LYAIDDADLVRAINEGQQDARAACECHFIQRHGFGGTGTIGDGTVIGGGEIVVGGGV
jgi:hypothetical protein